MGLRVWGLGFRVEGFRGLGIGVSSPGFWEGRWAEHVSLGFRVQGLGFRVIIIGASSFQKGILTTLGRAPENFRV